MDLFSSQYRTKCEQAVSHQGFSRKKDVFIRVVNDVCQSFYMEQLNRGPCEKVCRIGFSVLSLGQKVDVRRVENGVGLYYLRKFEICDGTEIDGWRYKLNPEDISSCIEEILRYLEKYLIPFFERANCSEKAFFELIALEKLFNNNRIAYLKLNGREDLAGSGAELNLFDSAKYYMALKNGNHSYAKKRLSALLDLNLMSYENEKRNLSEDVLADRRRSIQQLLEEVVLLETGNVGYFQHLIEENEVYSRESLKRYIC